MSATTPNTRLNRADEVKDVRFPELDSDHSESNVTRHIRCFQTIMVAHAREDRTDETPSFSMPYKS